MINRRRFLLSTSGAIAATTLPTAWASSKLPLDVSATPTEKSLQQKFKSKVGDTFLARSEQGMHWFKLKAVESEKQCESTEQFRLVFTGESNSFEETLYSVTHLKTMKTQPLRIEASDSQRKQFVSSFCVLT